MARQKAPSVIVQEMDCPPCMRCVYLPEHPPSIEALGFWGKEGVFALESELHLDGDKAPRRVWRTPPRWPVHSCREEDLMILEMVDPVMSGPAFSREPGSLSN